MSTNLNPIDRILNQVRKVVVGYPKMTELVAYSIFADGHVLLEGLPGLAKSVTVRAFGRAIRGVTWSRIQMTPNIQPADIVGVQIYSKKTEEFSIRKGPIFANIVLADEINRATPRSQSGLLEAMAEKSTSIADQTFRMPDLFNVLATQNPIEQEGTFPLPEAQLDRFLFKVTMGYAGRDDYKLMLKNQKVLKGSDPCQDIEPGAMIDEILESRKRINEIHVAEAALDYILDLVDSSRPGDSHFARFGEPVLCFDSDSFDAGVESKKFAESVLVGGSPRAYQAIQVAAQVRAFHMGREFILPEDIQYVAPAVLRHRLILQRKAKMSGKYSTDNAVAALLNGVPFHDNLNDYQK